MVYDISKGTSAALASKVKQAEEADQKAKDLVQKNKDKQEAAVKETPHADDKYLALFQTSIIAAQDVQSQTQDNLAKAKQNQADVQQARQDIGQIYHPYDLETAYPKTPEQLKEQLTGCFKQIDPAIEFLSERAKRHVNKARKLIDKMVGTLAFFFLSIQQMVLDTHASEEMKQELLNLWIPALYLKRIAPLQKDTQQKESLIKKAEALLEKLYRRDGPLSQLTKEQFRELYKTAKDCAYLFQRSSSCVEGRNAQLALRHHTEHRLNNRSIPAITAVHNFHITRNDQTTAAQRFFQREHRNLFNELLNRMDLPLRPRVRENHAVAWAS
mgnify:FL=1